MGSRTRESVLSIVIEIVDREIPSEIEITETTRFTEDLRADSLDLVEAVLVLEDKFEIENITEKDLNLVATIGDMTDLVMKLLSDDDGEQTDDDGSGEAVVDETVETQPAEVGQPVEA